jgi:DNA-binding protein HU-beta
MNKKELVQKVAATTKMTRKEIEFMLRVTLETLMNAVSAGEKVQLVGFGSFYKSKEQIKKKVISTDKSNNNSSFPPKIKFSPGKFFKEKVKVS